MLGAIVWPHCSAKAEAPGESDQGLIFHSELEPAYFRWVARPGEHLSVFDSITDLENCMERTNANATVGFVRIRLKQTETDGVPNIFHLSTGIRDGRIENAEALGADYLLFVGEFNNPFFNYYPEEFQEAHPEAFMVDSSGRLIEVGNNPIRNIRNPVPAVDSPILMKFSSDLIRDCVNRWSRNTHLVAWAIGGEEAWPDYFGLPMGDFRPQSMEHYRAFLNMKGWQVSTEPKDILSNRDPSAKAAWSCYRDQAMADRAAWYTRVFLDEDGQRPVFYPTHGHPFSVTNRHRLGQPPSLLAGACDGWELGHITINDDDERLNLIYLANFSAFGVPLIAPRLGNKTLDPEARGGGRSFTPRMLRRLVYECLGMGVWHIGPIHWQSTLGDGEWFIRGTPAEKECAQVFEEIIRAGPILNGMSRLQPSVGLLVADDTWIRSWNPKWSGLYQDAVANNWNASIVSDAIVGAELAERMPILLSIENSHVAESTVEAIREYIKAGGTLFIVGEFAEYDELGQPRTESAFTDDDTRVVTPNMPGTGGQRVLVNSFHTGQGAYHVRLPYEPVDAATLMETIKGRIPEAALRPISVESGNAHCEVFALTDGISLAAVLVNHSEDPATVRLKVALSLPDLGKGWAFYDVLTEAVLPAVEAQTTVVKLEGHGTALIWCHPRVSRQAVDDAVHQASRTVARWRALGVDSKPFERILSSAQECADSDRLAAKAYCLARRITGSMGVVLELANANRSDVRLRAKVFDYNEIPVEGAKAWWRLVPGRFQRNQLTESAPGEYQTVLSVDELARFYNPHTQRYEPVSGAVRIIVTVRNESAAGGTMSLHTF
jgi:hypothetical protein